MASDQAATCLVKTWPSRRRTARCDATAAAQRRRRGPTGAELSLNRSPRERAGEAGRAAVALARQLVAAIDEDLDAGRLHPPPGLLVALERQRDPRREREHVRAHRLELLVGNFHDLDPPRLEQLRQTHGQERRGRAA